MERGQGKPSPYESLKMLTKQVHASNALLIRVGGLIRARVRQEFVQPFEDVALMG